MLICPRIWTSHPYLLCKVHDYYFKTFLLLSAFNVIWRKKNIQWTRSIVYKTITFLDLGYNSVLFFTDVSHTHLHHKTLNSLFLFFPSGVDPWNTKYHLRRKLRTRLRWPSIRFLNCSRLSVKKFDMLS